MARDQVSVPCTAGVWTALNSGDASTLTFQVLRGTVFIRATTDTTTPTEAEGIIYKQGKGQGNDPISDYIQLAGADNLWAKPVGSDDALVYVDHA